MLMLSILLTGCIHHSRVNEKLPRPPERFHARSGPARKARDIGRWWLVFDDARLNRLMGQALHKSLTIEQAWARLEQARASLTLARAGYWPRISGKADVGRSHTAMRLGNLSSSFDRDTLSFSLSASYEIDLWGKVRYAAKAARLELEASEDDVRTAYLSVAAQLAESYFLAAELRAQLKLLEQTEQSRRQHLDLVRRRYDEGVVTALDMYQAEQNLATARVQQHVFLRQLAATETVITVLLGRAPGAPQSGGLDQLPQQVVDLPPGLPAQLLLRRPDLQSAHRRLMAADARIGQAVAGHYPGITLSASVGYQFDPAALVWSILGSLLVPIFEGNRVAADVDLKQAQLRLALATYEAALLQALKEVEDALVSGEQLRKQVEWLRQKVAAAEGALRMSTEQYAQGLTSFLQVLSAEQSVYTARSELISVRRSLVSARIQLARALGGSWMDQPMREWATKHAQSRKPTPRRKSAQRTGS